MQESNTNHKKNSLFVFKGEFLGIYYDLGYADFFGIMNFYKIHNELF